MTEPTTDSSPALDLTLKDPRLEAALAAASDRAVKESWADRAIGRRDPSIWSGDNVVQRAIATRLGWLEAPFHFADETGELKAFAAALKAEGFTTAVLGGMGGSSLAPALLAHVFGVAEGGIPVRVLDSTDPAAVADTLDDLNPTDTLFIVSTKSGTTAESLSFQAYQWARIDEALKEVGVGRPTQPGDFMAAVTDPEASLRAIPHHDEVREVFLNPPDIGGRYSALTYVGLVPGAILGIDLERLLERARAMVMACGVSDPAKNPGLALGLAMGVFAANGRDKLTFVIDRELSAFGPWVEQLIAESTGKETLAASRSGPRQSAPASPNRLPTASASSPWTANRSAPPAHTAAIASSSASPWTVRPARNRRSARTSTPAWRSWPRPDIRSSASPSARRSRSAPSSCAGRSRPRWPA